MTESEVRMAMGRRAREYVCRSHQIDYMVDNYLRLFSSLLDNKHETAPARQCRRSGWRLAMQVDFMLIGAQKCGTTTLANQLASHPGICFCREKEPGYFNSTDNWQAGLDTYHALYDPRPGQLCGEGSTMYTFLPEFDNTHERLYAYNPDLKFIYVMRHPVERVISNYAHRLVRNTVSVPPQEAVFAKPEYVNRSRYGVQLRPYVKLFGRERISVAGLRGIRPCTDGYARANCTPSGY